MIDRIVPRSEMRKTLAWLLRFFAAAERLPHPPRRRAGESLARFRAASEPVPEPVGHSPRATPAPPAPAAAEPPAPATAEAPAPAGPPEPQPANAAGADLKDE
jgi:hypothetical protein